MKIEVELSLWRGAIKDLGVGEGAVLRTFRMFTGLPSCREGKSWDLEDI